MNGAHSQTASTPLWKSPWMWAFVFGLVVLPAFRPLFSRVAPPPPNLGQGPSGALGQGVITLSVWCGEVDRCTTAQASEVFKTSRLLEQAGHEVAWRVYLFPGDKFGRSLQRWCAERDGRCLDGARSGDARDRLSSALRTQQTVRHELVHTASDVSGSLSLMDPQERVRGVFHASAAEARREIAHRVEALVREMREASK
jgi:hypothetical protein